MKEGSKRKGGLLALTLLLITILALTSGTNAKPDHKKVLLRDVTTLTLTDGQFTTGRRSSPVPQLLCVGGSAGCPSDGKPKTVQCTQTGFDGYDATWECKADLDNQYKFGRISVICEGYEYPEDPYILAGSCGLEYELDSTSARNNYNQGSYHYNYGSYYNSQSSSWYSILIFIFIAFIVYSVCFAAPHNGYQPYGGQGGYGGGYGGGPGGGGGGGGGPGGPGCGPSYSPPPSSGNNFWGGLATGGLLGYMLGGRRYGGYGGYAPGYGGYGYGAPRYGGGGFGGGGFGGGGFGGGGGRMASGFGGTRRR